MALRIDELKSERSTRDVFVSNARLLITEDDEVVGEDDPRGVRLLVGAGSSIPMRIAEQYGLVRVREAEVLAVTGGTATLDQERAALEAGAGPAPVPGQLVTDEHGDAKRFVPPLEDKSRIPDGDKGADRSSGQPPADSDKRTGETTGGGRALPPALAFLEGNAHEAAAGAKGLESVADVDAAKAAEEALANRKTVLQAIERRRAELAE